MNPRYDIGLNLSQTPTYKVLQWILYKGILFLPIGELSLSEHVKRLVLHTFQFLNQGRNFFE